MVRRIFDSANSPFHWSRNPGDNYMFLIERQVYANQLLAKNGLVTINQVLRLLGMDDIGKKGLFLGWRRPDVISFGLEKYDSDKDIFCFTGGLPDYVLEFNCGRVYIPRLPFRTRAKIMVTRNK